MVLTWAVPGYALRCSSAGRKPLCGTLHAVVGTAAAVGAQVAGIILRVLVAAHLPVQRRARADAKVSCGGQGLGGVACCRHSCRRW